MKYKFINNYKIYAFKNKAEFLNYIKDKNKILVAMNAEKILKNDNKLNEIVNNNIGYPDGVGAVMALKRKGIEAIKIAGAEFWLDIIERFYRERSFYLLGSSQEVIDSTIARLKNEFESINIVGYRNGFLDETGKEELKKALVEKKPDIVFVAQGTPRQEYLMDELIKVHPALYMGLGGSFDVYCGLKKRAPKLFIDLQLEWLYRLFKEPTRIKRQWILAKFLFMLKIGKL